MIKIKNSKKGLELSLNFFIMMILAIIIFIFGLIFLRDLFSKAMDTQKQIDQSTEEQIRGLLSQGQKVAIPVNRKTIGPGEADAFGLGILNVDTTGNKDFYVTVEIGDAYDENGVEITSNKLTLNDILMRQNPIAGLEIPSNKEEILTIGVTVPSSTDLGTHILNVYVCLQGANEFDPGAPESCDSTLNPSKLYDNSVHKLYVEVP